MGDFLFSNVFGKSKGFTLVELIMVIVLLSAIGSMVSAVIVRPFTMYQDMSRRAQLVGLAETAISRIVQDIDRAIPNSLRVTSLGNKHSLELMSAFYGGRYRAAAEGGNALDRLDVTASDNSFNIFAEFDATIPTGTRLIVGPLSTALLYQSAAQTDPLLQKIVTPSDTQFDLTAQGNETQIELIAADLSAKPFEFEQSSPRKRMFFTDSPITYLCDEDTKTITRYSKYDVEETGSTTVPTSSTDALLIENALQCDFNYDPGSPQRNGVITIALTVELDGENVTLVRQVFVINAP
ncbi:MAG: type II secretion system protein [Pseudomonadota bacterium]